LNIGGVDVHPGTPVEIENLRKTVGTVSDMYAFVAIPDYPDFLIFIYPFHISSPAS
jgi:hypothetical protein